MGAISEWRITMRWSRPSPLKSLGSLGILFLARAALPPALNRYPANTLMKKKFLVRTDRAKIRIVLTRDSVCAADDFDAPHERSITIHPFMDLESLAREISSSYLPAVAGNGHRWTCVLNNIQIAEITTTGIRALVREPNFDDDNRIHFVYHSATY